MTATNGGYPPYVIDPHTQQVMHMPQVAQGAPLVPGDPAAVQQPVPSSGNQPASSSGSRGRDSTSSRPSYGAPLKAEAAAGIPVIGYPAVAQAPTKLYVADSAQIPGGTLRHGHSLTSLPVAGDLRAGSLTNLTALGGDMRTPSYTNLVAPELRNSYNNIMSGMSGSYANLIPTGNVIVGAAQPTPATPATTVRPIAGISALQTAAVRPGTSSAAGDLSGIMSTYLPEPHSAKYLAREGALFRHPGPQVAVVPGHA